MLSQTKPRRVACDGTKSSFERGLNFELHQFSLHALPIVRKIFRAAAFCMMAAGLAPKATYSASASSAIIEARFQSGLTSLGDADYGKAIQTFQGILAQDPSLTRVRLELARAYLLAEQWNRSRLEFFKVLSGDIPDPVRRTILQFIATIDARRGFEWDLELSFKRLGSTRDYDTDQINLAFSGITLPASINRSNESAYGLGYSASMLWRQSIENLSNGNRVTIGYGEVFSYGNISDEKEFRDVTVGLRGGARLVFQNTTAVISPVFYTRYLADTHFENRFGVETSFERRNLDAYSIFGTLSAYQVENMFDDTFSGHATSLRLGVRRSFDGKSTVGAALFGEVKSTDRDIDTYTLSGVEIFGSFDLAAGIVVEPLLYVAKKSFKDINPLFLGSPDESQYGAKVRVQKRDLIFGDGFVPFFEAEYNRVTSNIDAFSYDETLVNLGVTKAF